jgi:hypothetical protein
MTAKDQLIQELPQLTEDLAAQVLTFIRSARSHSPQAIASAPLRPYGLCAGEFVLPDDFDAPLPEDILQAFENPEFRALAASGDRARGLALLDQLDERSESGFWT